MNSPDSVPLQSTWPSGNPRNAQRDLWARLPFAMEMADVVTGWYIQYQDDLRAVRESQMRLYARKDQIGLQPQLGDLEAEITYLRLRALQPRVVVEVSPGTGWSTSWILHALKDNGNGLLYSYDLHARCTHVLPADLTLHRWVFHHGDVRRMVDTLPAPIDYLFIDSDHSAGFAWWYIGDLFPALPFETPISAHDILKYIDEPGWGEESEVLCTWLADSGIPCFTASRALPEILRKDILALRAGLRMDSAIHSSDFDSMIFFRYSAPASR